MVGLASNYFVMRALKTERKKPQTVVHFPGLGIILWIGLYTSERIVIQWTLFTASCYLFNEFLGEQCAISVVSFSGYES